MNILAVDTSALTASAAVMSGGVIIAEVSVTNSLTHSQTIMPMTDYVLKSAGLSVNDIDLFAASNGPGSFTGLRIGVGTIKGLSYGCSKRCVGVSTLLALAHNIAPTELLIVPIMDARRNQVYTAAYRYESGKIRQVISPLAAGVDDLCLSLKENVIFVGDAIAPYEGKIRSLMGERAHFAPPQLRLQRAASVAAAALDLQATAPEKLEVVYLRKPQAEREREEKMQNI